MRAITRIPARRRGRITRRVVNVSTLHHRIDRTVLDRWKMGVHVVSLFHAFDRDALAMHQRATLDTVGEYLWMLPEMLERHLETAPCFAEWLTTQMEMHELGADADDDDDELPVWDADGLGFEEFPLAWRAEHAMQYCSELPLCAYGVPLSAQELNAGIDLIFAVRLLFDDTPYAVLHLQDRDTIDWTVLFGDATPLMTLPPLPRDVDWKSLIRELNRRPVAGITNLGDLVAFIMRQTGNSFADLSQFEVDEVGGWGDNDVFAMDPGELALTIENQQEAIALAHALDCLIINSYDIVTLVCAIRGAAAVVQAAMPLPGMPLIDLVTDMFDDPQFRERLRLFDDDDNEDEDDEEYDLDDAIYALEQR